MCAAALHGALGAIGADQRVVWVIAAAAIMLLTATAWLLRRRSRTGRQAAAICITLSVLLHVVLISALPLVQRHGGGAAVDREGPPAVVADVTFSDYADGQLADASADGDAAVPRVPLPLPLPSAPPDPPVAGVREPTPPAAETTESAETTEPTVLATLPDALQSTPATQPPSETFSDAAVDAMLSQLLLPEAPAASEPADDPPEPADTAATAPAAEAASSDTVAASDSEQASNTPPVPTTVDAVAADAFAVPAPAHVVGGAINDFAHRTGGAKAAALATTGGDAESEAAVAAGLRWLVRNQRADGAWDPIAGGAGQERSPLGLSRAGAGRSATTGVSGLALLALLGAGNTHQQGEYAGQVHAGLSYLIRNQAPDGSLAGNAGTYDRTYSHGMAALALCEAAAMTRDPAAIAAAEAAIAYTARLQHPTTGGWRYTAGDPGDLSQLGWQAMVLSSGRQAGIAIPPQTTAGAFRFLRSVRSGRAGGLACYRPGEAPTRTMTAEALATRLLLGERVPPAEIAEAEAYLLAEPPGIGQDNYYYWYYASLALHQLQDDAWRQWNARLKQRLIARQLSDGSWPTDSVWGGYGGSVYTTAIGCLCLEVYYRHLRQHAAAVAAPPATTQWR